LNQLLPIALLDELLVAASGFNKQLNKLLTVDT